MLLINSVDLFLFRLPVCNGTQIVDERFLVYVNDLLTSGVIPNLFTKDEYDAIFQAIRVAAKSAGVPDVRDSLMQFFVDRYAFLVVSLHLFSAVPL